MKHRSARGTDRARRWTVTVLTLALSAPLASCGLSKVDTPCSGLVEQAWLEELQVPAGTEAEPVQGTLGTSSQSGEPPLLDCQINRGLDISAYVVDEYAGKRGMFDDADLRPMVMELGDSSHIQLRFYRLCAINDQPRLAVAHARLRDGARYLKPADRNRLSLFTARVLNAFANEISCTGEPTPEKKFTVNSVMLPHAFSEKVSERDTFCGAVPKEKLGKLANLPDTQEIYEKSSDHNKVCEISNGTRKGYIYLHTLRGKFADPALFWPPGSPLNPEKPLPKIPAARTPSVGFVPMKQPGMVYGWIQAKCEYENRIYVIHAVDELKPRLPEILRTYVTATAARDRCEPSYR